jgi:large subunit ribosomal protein L24
MFKFKINDQVKITSGKDKGQTGKIIKVLPAQSQVLVEGKNTYKKHVKKQMNQAGQVVTLERPLSVAKIALICPHCQKTTRIAFDATQQPKVRVCRKCGQVINTTTTNAKS